MKRIEIYLDESGEIRSSGRPMNVTGVVMISENGEASNRFHWKLYESAARDGLLAGLCDGGSSKIIHTNSPIPHLPKRPRNGEEAEHRVKVLDFIGHATEAAKDSGVEIGAFSLVFPCNAAMPWHSLTDWEDQLLDRSYLERLKDALELMFFECPWLRDHLSSPCQIAIDLPTRSANSDIPPNPSLKECGALLWSSWGIKNDGEGSRELRACSLAPADGAEILTSVLARRHRSLPESVTILGARCVRLMDWETWRKDCPNPAARNTWNQKYLAPKQVHYLADLLANSVYQKNSGSVLHKDARVLPWYERGYFLNAAEVDPWILASRMFANGDRLGALRLLTKNKKAMNCGGQADFFRSRCKEWFSHLAAGDLHSLFEAARPKMTRPKRQIGATVPQTPALSGKTIVQYDGIKTELALEPKPESSIPPAGLKERSSDAKSALVRWRVCLELPNSWSGQTLMEAVGASGSIPEPICIRPFPKDDIIEFLLDLRSAEEVGVWVDSPVLFGGITVTAKDATLPSSFRVPPSSAEEAG